MSEENVMSAQEIASAEKVRLIAVEMMKIISELPVEVIAKYQLTPAKLDDVFKPIAERFYATMAENDVSLENLEDSIELIAQVETLVNKRILNYFDLTVKYVYKRKMGYEDPFKEMGVGEWEKTRNDFAKQEVSELSTENTA